MDRRKFLLGVGSASIGGSALLGSAAFSRVESQRSVTIQVAEDPDAYLGLDACQDENGNTTPNSSFTDLDDHGHLEVDMTPDNPTDVGGQGVNSDSRTWFDNVFQLCNQGKQLVCVHIEDDEDWPFYDGDERRVDFYLGSDRERSIVGEENGVALPVGECVCVGIRTTTKGLSEEDRLLEALDDEITIVADDDCPSEVPPEEGEGVVCGEKKLTKELKKWIKGLDDNDEYDPDNPLAGWEIQLTPNSELGLGPVTTTTDENGEYCFTDVVAGEYIVCEVPKFGAIPIDPENGCYENVTVGAGDTVEGLDFENDIDIEDEDEESPEPRTIGFWSNWSCGCTPGGQANRLGDALSAADRIELGDLTVTRGGHATPPNCGAVDLLTKRDLDGNVRASDGAYNLASQLLAAKLNRAAGADVPDSGTGCENVDAQITAGQTLLEEIGFDGTGSYLPPGATRRQEALDIAACLDHYNNGEFTQ